MIFKYFIVVCFIVSAFFSLFSVFWLANTKDVNQYVRDISKSFIRFAQFLVLLTAVIVFELPEEMVGKFIELFLK